MATREATNDARQVLLELSKMRAQDHSVQTVGHCIERVSERAVLDGNWSNVALEDEWLFCEDMLDICNRMNLGQSAAACEYRDRMHAIERLLAVRQ